jgi:hypothetical protein
MAENDDNEKVLIDEEQLHHVISLTVETAMIGIKVARLLASKDNYTHDEWRLAMTQYGNHMIPFIDIVWPIVETTLLEGGITPERRNRTWQQVINEAESKDKSDELQPEVEVNSTEEKRIMERLRKMPKWLKVLLFGTLFVVLALIFTNPSMTRFKEFVPSQINDDEIEGDKLKCSKTRNWLIFSVYIFEYREGSNGEEDGEFWGVFNNFFEK